MIFRTWATCKINHLRTLSQVSPPCQQVHYVPTYAASLITMRNSRFFARYFSTIWYLRGNISILHSA